MACQSPMDACGCSMSFYSTANDIALQSDWTAASVVTSSLAQLQVTVLDDSVVWLYVRAKDVLNRTGPTAALRWFVDVSNPVTVWPAWTLTSSYSNDSSPEFSFACNKPFPCRFEGLPIHTGWRWMHL